MGVDFGILLDGIDAEINLSDSDPVSRALALGIAFGLQLGLDHDVSDWPVRSAFRRD